MSCVRLKKGNEQLTCSKSSKVKLNVNYTKGKVPRWGHS